jgi:hypothetical protein
VQIWAPVRLVSDVSHLSTTEILLKKEVKASKNLESQITWKKWKTHKAEFYKNKLKIKGEK